MALQPRRNQAVRATDGAGAVRRGGGGSAAAGSATPAFVGRDDALVAVTAALGQGPALVLIEGEAGIGKSRLVREALQVPDVRDRTVLVAACPPVAEPFPLGPIVDALRRLRPHTGGKLALSALGGALRPLFPEWAEQLPPALEGLDDPKETRHRLLAALTELLERLAVEVLVIEDVHWADAATLEWLLTLTTAEPAPWSVVVTYRPTDVPDGSLLPRLTSRVPAGMGHVRVELEPLDVAATSRLVESMLGADSVSEEFASFLHGRTDGVPLAVEESVRLLRERHDIIRRQGGWTRRVLDELKVPPTVRDSVLERVDRLDLDTRKVLQAAAIVAEPADELLLAAAANLDVQATRRGIARGLATGLLREVGGGQLAFRHVLDAHAIEEAIPASDQWELHRRAADALRQLRPEPVVRLARHYRAANDTEQWCHYAEAAADLALESGDDRTAVTLMYDALTGTEHPAERGARLARRLGEAASYWASPLGDLAERVPDALRAVLADGEVPASERGMIRLMLGKLLYWQDTEAAMEVIEAALPDLADRPGQAARAMQFLAMPVTAAWPATRHLAWLERATALLPQIGSAPERLSFIVNRASVLLLLGREEGWQAAADIPSSALSALDNRTIANGMLNVALAATRWGHYAEARSRLRHVNKNSEAASARLHINAARVAEAYLDWYTGAWDGLADTAEELAKGEETRPDARLEARIVQGMVEIASGHRSVAEQRLCAVGEELTRRGLVEPEAVPQAAAVGRMHIADGETAKALRVTAPVVDMIARKRVWLWATDVLPVHVDALVGADELDQAETVVGQYAKGLAGRNAPAPAAAFLVCRAIVTEASGDLVEAAGMFAEAASAWAALPRPYDELLTLERQGRCLLAVDQQERGLAVLSEAQHRLSDLGARWDADRVAHVLREHGVEVTRAWRRGPRGYGDQLSPRELEVVALVAQGMTNKQIADVLFVSFRTVERHVRKAMRKLEVSSRTALAVAATEAGLISSGKEMSD